MVELKHRDLATDEDKQYGIDKWARLFKSTTWEEVKSLTENNAFIQSAARSMFKREVDESTLRLCSKLEWEIAAEERRNKRLAELESKTTEQATTITSQAVTINEQAVTINEQATTITDLQTENATLASTINKLKEELAALKGQ